MARISIPRSWNSTAASPTASSDCVTRTRPSWPSALAMRAPISSARLRFLRARGLRTTPMPPTLCRRPGGRELSARRLDVRAPTLADRGVEATLAQDGLEAQDAWARARSIRRTGERVERDQVHLCPQRPQQAEQAARVGVRVVRPIEHHVLEGDATTARQRHLAAS